MRIIVNLGAALALLVFLPGCASQGRQLMPMPNLYAGAHAPELFAGLPDELMNNQADILYLTDREPEFNDEGRLEYGSGRSRSVAFGSAIVTIKPEMSWEELEQASLAPDRSVKLTLELTTIEELGRFAPTPPDIVVVDNQSRVDPEFITAMNQAAKSFRQEVQRRLERASSRDVVMFIHGFNETFDDAAFTLAELWHYLGREHVPILYTWPAGLGGPAGYIYDRESGEFTIYHLKSMLRELNSIQDIQRIHIIAHSRGTDVVSTAFRELAIEARASKSEMFRKFQRSHLVLAAPDLDMDVVSQRIVAEQLGRKTKNITIYTSQTDMAIGLAERFFKSAKRIGRLGMEDMQTGDLLSLENIEGLVIIEVEQAKSQKVGHSYFHNDAAAGSDLILTIRYNLEPGIENGRPLQPLGAGFWKVEQGYPFAGSNIQ